MKLSSLFLLISAVVIAIAAGWIYQSQSKMTESRAEIEIPVDIDYYLSKVNYRVMNEEGLLDYHLKTPYLQHYRGDDISKIDTPEIDIYRKNDHWQLNAKIAEMRHKQKTLLLIDDVVMEKQGDDAMVFSAEIMRFESNLDLVTSERNVRLISKNTQIDADKAVFDLDKNIYQFTNTRAVYNNEKS